MNKLRIWLPDTVEPEGGFWCYGTRDRFNRFIQDGFDYAKAGEVPIDIFELSKDYKIEWIAEIKSSHQNKLT